METNPAFHRPKKMINMLWMVLSVMLCLSCAGNNEENSPPEYQKYIPQDFDGDKIIKAPEFMTPEHQKNVIHVLKFYGEDWKLENGELFVSTKIDSEILWNYTSKANDSIWLAEHPLE
jgi:hypothetical protein